MNYLRLSCGLSVLVCLLLVASASRADEIIRRDSDPLRWTITTANSSYQVILGADSVLEAGWFGPRLGEGELEYAYDHHIAETGTLIREVPFRGGGYQELEPALEVISADGVRELELVYDGCETGSMDGYPFIRFDMRDTHYPLRVSEYIRVIPEVDIYEKWLVLENTGRENILIERAQSGSAILPPGQYKLTQLSGSWSCEFVPRTSLLTPGNKVLSVKGIRSLPAVPFS